MLFEKLGEKLGEQLGAKLGEQQAKLGEQLLPIIAALQIEAVSISGVDSSRWKRLQDAYGLDESPSPPPAGVPPRSIPAFHWMEEQNESAQAEDYMGYLRRNFPLGSDRRRTLMWIAGDKHKTLLSVSAPAGGLPFTINGTCDAVVVTSDAYRTDLYNRGLVLLFELKKKDTISSRAMHQAQTQLLLANLLSPNTKPVVVLTDLNQQWRILYFDGSKLHALPFDGKRDDAVGLIDKIIASYCTGDEAAGPLEEAVSASDVSNIFKRRRMAEPSSGRALTGDVGNLADLAGFLPEGEYMEARAANILSLFLRTPGVVEGLRGTQFADEIGLTARAGSPPAGMYA